MSPVGAKEPGCDFRRSRFLKEADASGGTKGYQTLINDALRQHVEGKAPRLAETLRKIVREELRAAG